MSILKQNSLFPKRTPPVLNSTVKELLFLCPKTIKMPKVDKPA